MKGRDPESNASSRRQVELAPCVPDSAEEVGRIPLCVLREHDHEAGGGDGGGGGGAAGGGAAGGGARAGGGRADVGGGGMAALFDDLAVVRPVRLAILRRVCCARVVAPRSRACARACVPLLARVGLVRVGSIDRPGERGEKRRAKKGRGAIVQCTSRHQVSDRAIRRGVWRIDRAS